MEVSLQECKRKYIVGSGWWCGENVERLKFGDDVIRSVDFHNIWLESLLTFSNPEKIIIVDSNSPIKPDISNEKVLFLSLNQNAGHSTNLNSMSDFCGWTASALLSMHYALHCDCDYFVYVEQDCVLYGKNIIEKQISYMESKGINVLFGDGNASFQPIQVSFFIVKKQYISELISKYFKFKSSDSLLSPEFKLNLSIRPLIRFLPESVLRNKYINYLFSKLPYSKNMKIGYGRERPIDFENHLFYFQQGTQDEISRYISLVNKLKNKEV